MLETVYVRCTHCGYDNSPEYRFCGMCGAALVHPSVPTQAKEPAKPGAGATESATRANGNGKPEAVHGPSFLGLAEDPKTEFHYLYEDEPPRSYAGVVFVLILLIALCGFGYWQWKHNGFPFNRLNAENKPAETTAAPSSAPAQPQDQQANNQKQMNGAGDVLPTAPEGSAPATPNNSTTKEVDLPPVGGQSASATNQPAPSATAPEQQTATAPEKAPEKTEPEKTEEAKSTPPPATTRSRTPVKAPPAPKPKAPAASATPAAPALPDADLELAGEKYLYGNGLPQNCTRAESALHTAAVHGNSKAQTVLGTMYATGHCVGKDLPTAYRWFARALRQDPQNERISADLQVLWRQMTPQEKQLATGGR